MHNSYQRWMRKQNRIRRHLKGRNYHHFFRAKSLGGEDTADNLLLIKIERHEAFNRLFGSTCSAERALAILQRVVRAKLALRETPPQAR